MQHNGISPASELEPGAQHAALKPFSPQQQHQQHQQQLWQQPSAASGDETGSGVQYPAVCGLLPPIDAGCGPPGASGALGSSESDDTPQHHLNTPTAAASASVAQQQQHQQQHQQQLVGVVAAVNTQGPGLYGQPGVITLALPAGLPATTSLLAPGQPVTQGKPPTPAPAAAANGAGSAAVTPTPAVAAAAAAAGGASSAAQHQQNGAAAAVPGPGALVTGQPVLGVPNLMHAAAAAAAAGFTTGPQALPQLGLPHPAAAAAMAAARTAGSILSGPSTLGVPAKPGGGGEDSSSTGGLAGANGSSSSQWCTPVCRRGLSSRGPCFHCGTTYSSQWRSGPPHKPVLCNACGLYYRKVQSLPDHTCQVAGALQVGFCVYK